MKKLSILICACLIPFCGFGQTTCSTAIEVLIGLNEAPSAPYYYTYTADNEQVLTISSVGYGVDTDLHIYDNCGGTLIAENDDINSAYESKLSLELEAGQSIIIEWLATWTSASFKFDFNRGFNEPVSESDSLALVALYNENNGNSWKINDNWLDTQVSYWYGITAANGGVTEINLSNNNLSGILTDQLVDISTLQKLVVDGNRLEGLSDLTSLPALSEFSISDNLLTFEDFEVNSSIITSNASQKSFGLSDFITINLGDNITLNPEWADAALNNFLQWERNLVDINSANSASYDILDVASSDEGVYTLKVTNSDFPSIVLRSNPITLSLPLLEADSSALVTLYNATQGEAWENNDNWLDGMVSSWHGIKLKGGRVAEVSLSANKLYGYLPSELWQLTALEVLDISENSFFKEGGGDMLLPSDIGMLTNLKHLNLNRAGVNGVLPSEFGNLINLEYLNLGNERTDEDYYYSNSNYVDLPLPEELKNLTSLKELHISSIRTSSTNNTFPEVITSLINLEVLRIYGSQFEDIIPSSIENLTKLKRLKTDIPLSESLKNISLLSLDITGNTNWGIDLSTLTSLEELIIRSNKLDDLPSLPSSLKLLDLGDNSFFNIPDVSGMALESLIMDNNYLEFDDLEQGAPIGLSTFKYVPQKEFGQIQEKYVKAGDSFVFSFDVPGSANSYQLAGQSITEPIYSVESAALEDEGFYQVKVTNNLVPDLTLTSAPAYLFVLPDLPVNGELFDRVDGGDLTKYGKTLQANYGGQWADIDNDGYEDVFITRATSDHDIRSFLYKNNGDGTFSKLNSNSYGFASGRNVTFGDFNNDGFLDYFSPNYSGSSVFSNQDSTYASIQKNNGDGTFSPIYLERDFVSQSSVWLDIENDNDLDLIIVSYQGTYLYINDGQENFTRDDEMFPVRCQWTPVAVDVNNDGFLDVFVPQLDFEVNGNSRALFINNGDGTFTSDEISPIVTDPMLSCRGASFADIDNDGDYDAYIKSYNTSEGEETRFYINDGKGNFTLLSSADVFGETIKGGRGSAFGDYDNDGYIDLFTVETPMSGPLWVLYKNNGDKTFTKQLNSSFIQAHEFIGTSMADYDNDGFLDIVATSFAEDYNGLYRNKGNTNNWIQFKLEGTISNKSAIGARIDVFTPDGRRNHQQVLTTNGFANQNSLTTQVGLGTNTAIDSVVISWPSGLKKVITDLEINKRHTIKETEDSPVLSYDEQSEVLLKPYPNPSSDIINVRWKSSINEVRVILYNISGEIVTKAILSKNDVGLRVSGIQGGVYLLEIRSDDKNVSGVHKVIIQNK